MVLTNGYYYVKITSEIKNSIRKCINLQRMFQKFTFLTWNFKSLGGSIMTTLQIVLLAIIGAVALTSIVF